MKSTIYFRVDGDDGKKIGLGHVTRCIKIYEELKKIFKLKYNFIFLMKNFNEGKDFVKSQTQEKIIIFNNYNLKKKIQFKKDDALVVDTLGIESSILSQVKKSNLKKIFCLEETKIRLKKTTIINGIFFAKNIIKDKKSCSIFQSPKYVILDKNYEKKKLLTPVSKKINFLVSSGGGDKKNFMFHVCKTLNSIENIKTFVIIGKAVKKDNPVFKFKNNKNFQFIFNKNNLYNFFARANISFVSGGTVMFESICSGTKTLVCQTYDNQKFAINYFLKKGLITKIPNFKSIKRYDLLREINLVIKNKNKDFLFRKQIREIDGKGLLRTVNIIKKKL